MWWGLRLVAGRAGGLGAVVEEADTELRCSWWVGGEAVVVELGSWW